MTQTADEKEALKEAKKEAIKARSKEMVLAEEKANEGRTGKGTRIAISLSRGRNPQQVEYEFFDESLPDTLPKTLTEFMDLSKVNDEAVIVSYLIDGFNSASYTNASDPVAEYIEASWSDDVKKGFKLVVKNYAANLGVSIEDAAGIIKPAYVASQAKK